MNDPLLDHNDGLFRLSVNGGTATVDPLPASDSTADVAVDIATLSQLAVGTHGVDAAERLAGLEMFATRSAARLQTFSSPNPST